MLIPFGILSAAGAGGGYELIETQILTATASQIQFASLGSFSTTYKHLQIRYVAGNTNAITDLDNVALRFNGQAGGSADYSHHRLWGSGSSVNAYALSSTSQMLGGLAGRGSSTIFAANIVDILDPFSTTKNKTIRVFTGGYSPSQQVVGINSGARYNTASITSIELSCFTDLFRIGSRFSLYGIR
jgi:hypothetical protein